MRNYQTLKFIFVLFALNLTLGCTPEKNYRGVPSTSWQHLTAEQKQLIVDQSFKDEMEKAGASSNDHKS